MKRTDPGAVQGPVVRELGPDDAPAVAEIRPTVVTAGTWPSPPDARIAVYGVFDKDRIEAVFALQSRRRWGLTLWSQPSMAPHCGLVFRDAAGPGEKRNSAHKRAVAAVAEFLGAQRASIVSVVFPDSVADLQPFLWQQFKVSVSYTYQIRLPGASDADLLARMSGNRSREIRGGAKRNLRCEPCTDLALVERLAGMSLSRQGVGGAEAQMREIVGRFATPASSFAYATWLGEAPVAVCFCIHDCQRAYYLVGGVDAAKDETAASPMAIFAGIRHARDLGLEIFDFEGSSVPGIERFFRGFGGDLVPQLRVVRAPLLVEMALKPFKRSLF